MEAGETAAGPAALGVSIITTGGGLLFTITPFPQGIGAEGALQSCDFGGAAATTKKPLRSAKEAVLTPSLPSIVTRDAPIKRRSCKFR
jgi:hypothetical protein